MNDEISPEQIKKDKEIIEKIQKNRKEELGKELKESEETRIKNMESSKQAITKHIGEKAFRTEKRKERDLKKKEDVILLSDHGCVDGVHTEQAYFGSDYPILAESIHELRHEFERIFDLLTIERWNKL